MRLLRESFSIFEILIFLKLSLPCHDGKRELGRGSTHLTIQLERALSAWGVTTAKKSKIEVTYDGK